MEKVNYIKKLIAIVIMVIIFVIVASIILRYYVEGEKNMPFQISKIIVISTAGGTQKTETDKRWDMQIFQNNDIYIDIIKNKNYTQEEIIDKIIVNNFVVETQPQKGELKKYKLDSENINVANTEENLINEQIEYTGAEKTDLKNLTIANQGGLITLRYVNQNLGTYTSNEDMQVVYDGTILQKIGITLEEIKFKVSFDIAIELKSGKKYKSNISIDMPIENLIQEGTTNTRNRRKQYNFQKILVAKNKKNLYNYC